MFKLLFKQLCLAINVQDFSLDEPNCLAFTEKQQFQQSYIFRIKFFPRIISRLECCQMVC